MRKLLVIAGVLTIAPLAYLFVTFLALCKAVQLTWFWVLDEWNS